jgi:CHAT domain-containing protein
LNRELKVLIIADPAKGDLHLEGARREGIMMRDFFENLKESKSKGVGKLEFQIDAYIGGEECDIVKILSRIFTEDYDLIHFSGHGTFDANDETNSGWVFGRDEKTGKIRVLSAREIFRLRRIPRLVFSNACFSAQVAPDGNFSTEQTNQKMAGIAQAFFECGIENYIGTGWQVDDSLAVQFAEIFYETATQKGEDNTISYAFKEARKKIKDKEEGNSTWGAYQHYGNPNTRLVR